MLLVAGGYEDAVCRAADLWEERIRANRKRRGYRLTMSAPTNADARAVAAEIRARRRQWGELAEDVTTLAAVDQAGVTFDLPLAAGDRVRLFSSVRAKPDGAARAPPLAGTARSWTSAKSVPTGSGCATRTGASRPSSRSTL